MSAKLPKTRLELIMNITGITGKQIANDLFIDMSLISRWKNGKRDLNDVDYATGIAGFFVEFNHSEFIRTIQILVHSKESQDSLQEDLAKWLMMPLSKEDDKKLYVREDNSIDFRTYIGDTGRVKGLEHFLNIALLLEQPCDINIYIGEEMDSLIESNNYRNLFIQKIEELCQRSYRITIIHSIKNTVDKLKTSIISWMPQYLLDEITIYIIGVSHIHMSWHSIYIIDQVYMLAGYLTSEDSEDRYTMLTNDALTIHNTELMFRDILKASHKLKTKLNSDNLAELFTQINNYGQNYDSSLFKSDEMFFSTMSQELLEEVLACNNVNNETKLRVMNFYKQLNNNFKQNVSSFVNKHIYDYSLLVERMKYESINIKHLGLFTNQKIIMTRAQYVRHIKAMVKRIKINDYFKLGLYRPDDDIGPLQEINLWIKEGCFAAIWLCNWEDELVMINNPTCVESTLLAYNDMWDKLDTINKEQDHVIKMLEKIIRIAEKS